jgi:STE24 endopeptidase
MTEALAAFVALTAMASAFVYWQEAQFQTRQPALADASRRAATEVAYVGIATSVASAALRVFFILHGIRALLSFSFAADASALSTAILLAVLIAGGVFLLERLGRAYQTFIIDGRLRLNNTTAATYLSDTARALLVAGLFTLPLIAGSVWLMETGSALWWLGAWALWFVLLSLRMLVKPHLETLLFAETHELPVGELRSRLTRLLDLCGVKIRSLRVIEASKRTNRLNASVTGLGAHKHILLFDTLVQRLGVGEVEAVLAHEAGHVHHGHLAKAWAGIGILGLAGAYAMSEVFHAFSVRPAEAIGLTIAVYPSVLFCLRPLFVRVSRSFEFQADAFAAKQCGANAIGDALHRIFAVNRGVFDHHWSYAAVFAGHPSGAERLRRLKEIDASP